MLFHPQTSSHLLSQLFVTRFLCLEMSSNCTIDEALENADQLLTVLVGDDIETSILKKVKELCQEVVQLRQSRQRKHIQEDVKCE